MSSTITAPAESATSAFRADATTISVVSLAHATSHFFQLLLPPLFPWLATEFSLSFAELGTLASLFYLVSAFGQAAAGFLVDRLGARVVMFTGLLLFAVAAFVGSHANGYAMLVATAVIAGIANSPFHPVDYSIINQRISAARIGHAYSAHGLSGTLGYASATLVMVVLAQQFGWRNALATASVFALCVLAVAVIFRDAIDTRSLAVSAPKQPSNAAPESSLAFMRQPVVWMCFAFFFVITFSNSAIQNFATPALQAIAGLSLTVAATALTGYLVCSAIGQVAGGFAISRQWADPENIIAGSLTASAALLVVAATGWAGGIGTLLLVMLAGLGTGVAGPSRDLLIKRATPAGATGRVYGTVYSGLDAGLAVSAPLFGWLMDHDLPRAIFIGAAIAMVVATLIGLGVARAVNRSRTT
jgi:MFS transporter, FSR family, fosmidomycin resistance protein